MRLGLAVREEAHRKKPAVNEIELVTNTGDTAVNNHITETLARVWRERGVKNFRIHRIPFSLHIGHELFEPDVFDQKYNRILCTLTGIIEDGL
jgi:hypothetical protein